MEDRPEEHEAGEDEVIPHTREQLFEPIQRQDENRVDHEIHEARRVIPPRLPPVEDDQEFEQLLIKMQNLGMVVGEPRRLPQVFPIREVAEGGVLTRAQRNRRQYAVIQKMYSRDKAEALKYIVDRQNHVERSTPSPEVRREWCDYFKINPGLGRVQDAQTMADDQDLDQLSGIDGPITMEELEAAISNTSPSTARGMDGISLVDIKAMDRGDVLQVLNGIYNWTPENIFRGRITLIPKKNNTSQFVPYA